MQLDEGFMYGLGAFETIAVENGKAILLDQHLKRLNAALAYMQIDKQIEQQKIEMELLKKGVIRSVMKIMVSQSNTIFHFRENTYSEEDYKTGFRMRFSEVLRNDTSPLTYLKTLNYGDCILEKRQLKCYNETTFLNRRGEICEGSASNIFFVRDGKIKTPLRSCGLLPGIIRGFILENYDVEESVILRDDIYEYEECFVTNSIMGIMPVRSLESTVFRQNDMAVRMRKDYMRKFGITIG